MTPSRFTSLDRPPLDEDVLQQRLVNTGLFAQLTVVPTIESTNTTLKVELARALEIPGRIVLTTDHQVAGRGRAGRVWETPFGASIAVSIAVQPRVPQAQWGWLPLLAGLAVTRTLRRICGVGAAMKWPNDILVPDAGQTDTSLGFSPQAPRHPLGKVCGVLTEIVATPTGPAVVIGIGINVLQNRDELPVPTATSLQLAGATATERMTVLSAVLREFVAIDERWHAFEGDVEAAGLAAEVRESCATLGHEVTVRVPQAGEGEAGSVAEIVAVAEGLDAQGALTLRRPDGSVLHVTAGDVLSVRPIMPRA